MNANQKMKSFRDEPHVSYSQITTYMNCPLKYRFQYIDQVKPEFTSAALPFGGAFHETLAYFYRGLKDTNTHYSADDLIDVFKIDWNLRNECDDTIRFEKNDTQESMLEKGIAMIQAFHANVTPGEIIAVESEFCLRKADNNGSKPLTIPIVGAIDLVERDREGYIVAVDHKTAAHKYSDNKVEDDLQLTVYTCAVARSKLVEGDTEFYARFDVVTKTKQPELISYYTSRTENDHRRMMKLIREVLVGIESGVFYPIASWMCGSCAFKSHCNKW
jgi:putative RecB family exonuclease